MENNFGSGLTMVHFLFDEYKSIAANGFSGKLTLSACCRRFTLCASLYADGGLLTPIRR